MHAPHNTAVASSPAAQRQEASSSNALADNGSQSPSTFQATKQQNARKEQQQHRQQPEYATERTSVPSDVPEPTKPTRRVIQTDLIKQLQEQKKHNDQLDQSRNNASGSTTAVDHKVQQKQKHHQQQQQQQSMFPVLAKTNKLLLAKTKNADEGGVPAKKGGGGNTNGANQGLRRGARGKNVQAVGSKEGL